MVNMQAITLFALVLAFCSGSTECRRVQNNEYVLPENDPQEDEVRGYLLRDDINAKTEGAELAEQGDENMQSQELYTAGDKVHAYLQQDEENEKRDSAPPASKTRFKLGPYGTTHCPKGYKLVTDYKKCTIEAANFFDMDAASGVSCAAFEVEGCVHTMAEIYFNRCERWHDYRPTDEYKNPVCEECYTRKVRSFVPRGAEAVIKIVEGKTLEECMELCSEHTLCKAFEYFHEYGYRVPGSSVCHTDITHVSCGWKPKDCKLLRSSETALTDLNIDVYARRPLCMDSSCWRIKKRNRRARDRYLIKSYQSKTEEECKQLCQDTKNCNAMAYNSKGHNCWLYKNREEESGNYMYTDLFFFDC